MARYNPKKIRNAYFRSTFSITLVMFLIGFIAFALYNVYKAASIVVDNTSISVMLKDDIEAPQKDSLEAYFSRIDVIEEFDYISKDDALKEFKTFTGEDISQFVEDNPLPASYTLKLTVMDADLKTDAAAEEIATTLRGKEGVSEVLYQKELLSRIVRNVNIIYTISSLFFVVLLVISVMLVYNTINMAVYSRRFLIKTMCMAGATEAFIRKPFVMRSVKQAFIATLFTSLMLSVVIYFFFDYNVLGGDKEDIQAVICLFLGILVLSLLSCTILTTISVNKNMNLSGRKLHSY